MSTRINTYFLCILLFLCSSMAWAGNIENIRIGEKKSFTRIVFDLSAAPEIYKVNYLPAPPRIVIDFGQSTIAKLVLEKNMRTRFVKKITKKFSAKNNLILEIDLQQEVKFKHFILPPAKSAGYRLVVDLSPTAEGMSATRKDGQVEDDNEVQTIIAEQNHTPVTSTKQETSVTDYNSNPIDLYNNAPLTDARIDQLLKSFQGVTQIRDSYYTNLLDKTKPENVIHEKTDKDTTSAPRFTIRGYKVKGNTLLEKHTLASALKPFTGENKSFSDVQHALESLEYQYQQAGFGMVQVYLPEQELTNGIVLFSVIEPKVKTLSVEGAKYFSIDNIKNSLVYLQQGVTPNTRQLSQNLILLNENPAKKTMVQFLPSTEEGKLNSLITVKDKDPSSYIVSIDNTGTDSTGNYRVGLSYQNANLTDHDDVFLLNYTTSEKSSAISITGFGYHLPFYSRNSSLDVFGGYSKVDSGVIQNLFTVAGKGIVLGARYNQVLQKHGNYSQRLIYGIDYRQYDTDAVLLSGGGSFIPNIKVHPVNLTYTGQWTDPGMATSFNIQWHYNVFTTNQDKTSFTSSRTGAKPGYTLYRFGLEHAQVFAKDWQFRTAFSGQLTSDALISGEQFGIGGANSVRGYNERELANDKGYLFNAEIYSPDIWHAPGVNRQMRFLAFYDTGALSRNLAQPGDVTSASISSVGLGMRLNYKENLNFRLDLASALKATESTSRGATRLHAALNYTF